MKKTLIIASLLVAGATMAEPTSTEVANSPMGIVLDQEKVKIDPETLPDPVKASISNDASVATLSIVEAWKTSLPEDKALFAIIFDNGSEEKLTKKYDQEGNEIVE